MKLTKNQASKINEIIQEEVQNIMSQRRGDTIHEALNVGEIDEDMLRSAIVSDVEGDAVELASDTLEAFKVKFYSSLAKHVNEHGFSYDKLSANNVKMSMEDVDDEIVEIEMEITTAIESLLNEYVERMSVKALQVFSYELGR